MDQFQLNLQLFADDNSAQEPSIPEELQGMPDEFVAEVMAENEALNAETGVTGDNADKQPEDVQGATSQEPTAEPPKQEPNYKELYENMQKALKAEREKNRQPQQPSQQQPQQPNNQPAQVNVQSQIRAYAKAEAIKRLNIEGNPQDLMFTDTGKYEDYLSECAQIGLEETNKYNEHQRVYNENVNFVQELTAMPDFPALYQFAERELDELPRKQAKKIDDAFVRVNAGQGNREDMETIRTFVGECQVKREKANTQTKKLEQMANHPRANQVKGGGAGATVDPMELAENWDNLTKEQRRELERLTNQIY